MMLTMKRLVKFFLMNYQSDKISATYWAMFVSYGYHWPVVPLRVVCF